MTQSLGLSPFEVGPATAVAAIRAAAERHKKEPFASATRARRLGRYRGYAELCEAVLRLIERGAHPIKLGRSAQGEPLVALRVGAEPHRGQRTSVVVAGLHPMEWVGIEAGFRLVERVLDVAHELGDRSLVAFLLPNPDGVLAVEHNARIGRRRFVRHNAHGVDLNRNFDVAWGKRSLLQRMLGHLFTTGSRPLSEVEVEVIAHHLSSLRIDRSVSLHSFGGAVLTPHAYTFAAAHDAAEHREWAGRVARAIDPRRPYRAAPCSRWALNASGGLELDWFHERHGALSLLVECSRGGFGLRRPSSLIEPFRWFNPPRVEAEADAIAGALLPFVLGLDL